MKMNNGSKFGMFLGCLGGIVAIIGFPIYYESTTDAMAVMGALLLVAVMYFAIGGAFSKNGQWTPKALMFFTFLTAAVVVSITMIGYVDVIYGAVEVVIAALVLLCCNMPETARFVTHKE